MKVIKQSIGVDVAQDELVCSFGTLLEDLSSKIIARKTFANSLSGFKACLKWAISLKNADTEVLLLLQNQTFHFTFLPIAIGIQSA